VRSSHPKVALTAACAAAALLAPAAAQASCVAPPTGEELLASAKQAKAVFIGRAQAGDVADDGQLLSPIVFTVDSWLAGERTGASLSINTGFARTPGGGFVTNSIALSVRAGEQWMIDAHANADGALTATQCGFLTRRVDLAHPRTVRVKAGKPFTPHPVDLLGRSSGNAASGQPQPATIPRGTIRIAGRHIEAVRVLRGGKPRAAKRVSNTAWTVGALRKSDRVVWLDDRGLWGAEVR
jgi:hypothetical protein